MSFEIRTASRQKVLPLVGMYGRSGTGKTMSALLFARGLVGPKGRIVLVDSENKRGELFSDIIPGSYEVIDLAPPFSPSRYEEAIATAEKSADIVVVDSMSHEWSGEGGVLDWADQELERMGGGDNNKMRSWIKPKMAHKQMVMRLLRCAVPLICCLRGEEKTHMTAKGPNGEKGKVITDEFSSPLFDPRFIFELLLNFETVAKDGFGGYVIPRKVSHPSIAQLLPKPNEQITVAHGEALARWCAAPSGGSAAQSTPATAQRAEPAAIVDDDNYKFRDRALQRLREAGYDDATIGNFLIDKGWLAPGEPLTLWVTARVPRDKAALDTLKKEIEVWKG